MMHWNTGGLARLFTWGSGIALLIGVTPQALAINPQPDPPGVYALIGVNPFETMRFHVVNIGGTNGWPPGPCHVQMTFVTAAGTIVKSFQTDLAPGQAASLNLTFTDVFSEVGKPFSLTTRAEARPVYSATPSDSCSTSSATEVFETMTGQSRIYELPAVQAPPAAIIANPPPAQ